MRPQRDGGDRNDDDGGNGGDGALAASTSGRTRKPSPQPSITLLAARYTPPGYTGDSPLPTLLWAYPREYKSKVGGAVAEASWPLAVQCTHALQHAHAAAAAMWCRRPCHGLLHAGGCRPDAAFAIPILHHWVFEPSAVACPGVSGPSAAAPLMQQPVCASTTLECPAWALGACARAAGARAAPRPCRGLRAGTRSLMAPRCPLWPRARRSPTTRSWSSC